MARGDIFSPCAIRKLFLCQNDSIDLNFETPTLDKQIVKEGEMSNPRINN